MTPHLPAQTAPPPSLAVDTVLTGNVRAARALPATFTQYRGKKRGSGSDASLTGSSPSSSATSTRPIARIRSSKRTRVHRGTSPAAAGLSDSHPTDGVPGGGAGAGASRARENCSSPLKRARATTSGDIRNFHILPSSDDESDMELSPRSARSRAIPPVLRPSPLRRSFSTTSASTTTTWPLISQPDLRRPASAAVPGNTDSPVHTRARALLTKVETVEVEDLGTELNKVFMLVHGRGLGMGSTGPARNRRSSSLRPREQPDTPRSALSKEAMDHS